VPLGPAVAQQAADLAATHRLRGSDAVYAAVALRVGATLVTRDREQRERLNAVLTARYPEEGLATT
jgi:predicted nucleic acid-binding protein